MQSDALRADFLAYNQRTADAQVLLDHVLQEDPKNVSAHETKGYIEFQQGHIEEAKKWYAKAVATRFAKLISPTTISRRCR